MFLLCVSVRPLDVKIISPRRPLSAGKKSQISCESSGSRPSAVVTWWLGSKQLLHVTEEVSANQNSTISTLHFTPSAADQARILSCRADHAILPDSALEDSTLLEVYCKCLLMFIHICLSPTPGNWIHVCGITFTLLVSFKDD